MNNLPQIRFEYKFTFEDKNEKFFELNLDKETLNFIPQKSEPAFSTLLSHKKCAICSLNENIHHCPVALNLANVAEEFCGYFSHQTVTVQVTTNERQFLKTTSIQEGLSPLIGIIMVSSGCPVMEKLKPAVRFHLPFATLEETVFRMTSVYLLSQLFRRRKNLDNDTDLSGLLKIYEDVEKMNNDFALRLKDAADRDANLNALVNLACFATMLPMTLEDILSEIEGYFSAYFTADN